MNNACEMFLVRYKSTLECLDFNATYHRELVVKALFDASGYMQASEIKRKIKEKYRVEMKLGLIAKILRFLTKIDIVSVIKIAQNKVPRYRLRHYTKDGCFICRSCERVEEFEDAKLVTLVHQAAQKYGFEVDRNRAFVLNVR